MNIESILNEVLYKHHQNPYKRQLIDTEKSYNMACPICGDSKKHTNKKRGHLYKKNLFYVCYNCGVKLPFTEFLKITQIDLDPESMYKIHEQIAEYRSNVKEKQEDLKYFTLERKISLKAVSDYINGHPETRLRNFKPVQVHGRVWSYLIKERKISNLTHFYEAEYNMSSNKENWHPVMISLNNNNDTLLGFQWRNLEFKKDKRKFKIYNWQECWEMLHPDQPLSTDEYRSYNKISYIYNILNIDPEVPITIFEGFIDSCFVPNSIALVGVNTDYSFLMQDGITIRFFFDNDKDGHKATVNMINKGYSVFLWNKFFKDLASKSNNPDQNYYKIKDKIKDLNQLAKSFHNPYQNLDLEKFFAKDKFDQIYL